MMPDNKYKVVQTSTGRYLHIRGALPNSFHGKPESDGWHCLLDAQNAAAIRRELSWSAPQPVGMRKSIGCGDRLGIATPGHLRAVREGDMFPVLAQQSMREMQRAKRSPQQVLDDAMWGVIQADYRDGWGCDADHLKDVESIDACVAAGYVGYTLDPGAFVDDEANDAPLEVLRTKAAALSWDQWHTDLSTNFARYQPYMSELEYLRAAAKYGRALAHVLTLTQRIQAGMGSRPFDLEISVDETATVTTAAEHRYIVGELRRLNVPFTGIAPRFVGEFEKGVDYIGDLVAFEAQYQEHAALAAELGPYKMSIHSGSDKFSIYPIVAQYSNPLVHLKTAGTSWVEALRVIAQAEPVTFRKILALAVDGYETNRASYHVSGSADNVPTNVFDADLPTLIDHFDAREVLHVSFGPVLAQFYDDIYRILYANYELYMDVLHRHFKRHIQPFKAVETVT
jgi:hypothetical protein